MSFTAVELELTGSIKRRVSWCILAAPLDLTVGLCGVTWWGRCNSIYYTKFCINLPSINFPFQEQVLSLVQREKLYALYFLFNTKQSRKI